MLPIVDPIARPDGRNSGGISLCPTPAGGRVPCARWLYEHVLALRVRGSAGLVANDLAQGVAGGKGHQLFACLQRDVGDFAGACIHLAQGAHAEWPHLNGVDVTFPRRLDARDGVGTLDAFLRVRGPGTIGATESIGLSCPGSGIGVGTSTISIGRVGSRSATASIASRRNGLVQVHDRRGNGARERDEHQRYEQRRAYDSIHSLLPALISRLQFIAST